MKPRSKVYLLSGNGRRRKTRVIHHLTIFDRVAQFSHVPVGNFRVNVHTLTTNGENNGNEHEVIALGVYCDTVTGDGMKALTDPDTWTT